MTNFNLSPDEFLRLQREFSDSVGKCQILPMVPVSITKIVPEVYILLWYDLDGEHVAGVYATAEDAKAAQHNIWGAFTV